MRKKTIATTAVLGLLVAALTVPTFARGRHDAPHAWRDGGFGLHHEMRLEKMFEQLDLSSEQREQVFAVLDAARPSMRRLRFAFADQRQAFLQLDPTQADYPEKLQSLANEVGKLSGQMVTTFGETYAKVAVLLTPEQREQLQQALQKHQRRPRRSEQ